MNPISNTYISLVAEGNFIVRISPEINMAPNKKVTFHFKDGSNYVLPTECDHNTFMEWWRDTAALMRRIKMVEELPDFPSVH